MTDCGVSKDFRPWQ